MPAPSSPGQTRAPDFLVVGGGIVGLSVAVELRHRHPDLSVTLVEKETSCGWHASGRNSGVLHAGFYYSADTMKARLTRDGNREMRAFCGEHGLRVNPCGKLVVARTEADHEGLAELLRRAEANGVRLEAVDETQAKATEPRVKTCGKALFSPDTATVDPGEVVRAFEAQAVRHGVALRMGESYRGRGSMEAGYVVNCAGLYADRIARDFGLGMNYRILPFKGLYLRSGEPSENLRTNVYPVPDLDNPFLGVHFTKAADGHFKIGPTAIPCLWREQYGWLGRFRPSELLGVAGTALPLFVRAGFGFRRMAFQEIRKYWRPHLVKQAAGLVSGVRSRDYRQWERPGIRAQLVDVARRELVMDFRIEGDSRSMHVLNAVSPAFTCALPFARVVCDRIDAAR